MSGSRPCASVWRSPLGTHYEARVRASGVPLYFLGKGAGASGSVLRQLNALFRQYRPAVVHTHIIGLNYAYPLMLSYRTPARVHTVHNLAPREMGVRVGAWVRRMGVGRGILVESSRTAGREFLSRTLPPMLVLEPSGTICTAFASILGGLTIG